MKKIIISITTLVLVIGIPACGEETCGENFFTILDIEAYSETQINGSKRIRMSPNDTTNEEFYRVYCSLVMNHYSVQASPSLNPLPVQSSFALSCHNPKSDKNIDTIYIISKNKLAPNFSNNDTINNHILVEQSIKKTLSLSNYLKSQKARFESQNITFKLDTTVQNKTLPHSFTIVLKLDNGEVYTSTTTPVYFK